MKFSKYAVVIICLLLPAQAISADISIMDNKGILISGEIEAGDYKKFKNFVDENFYYFTGGGVFLNSRGGNVAEAMKMAKLIAGGYADTTIRKDDVCFSACVLLWASGIERSLLGKLGVHRISNAKNNLTIVETENSVRPASETVDTYLLGMGIPRMVVDRMNETLSTSLFIIDLHWVLKQDLYMAMEYRPSYIEVAEKKCGKDPYYSAMKTGLELNREAANQWSDCTFGVKVHNRGIEYRKFEAMLKADT